ncbi:CPBP family intramembrane glutamic endopeptidase [Cognatitamlana onchidii]|uniref:CPBP family intramembrane glutamic endopeptidase n=1 Tax=Cognatitamlana onchidii TaxID=2562860 RepID=UPI0010A64884|nr:CPBP family intramembrane glutamic endopeptidase [Algibacter onchidii]
MRTPLYKYIELFILFVFTPISFLFDYAPWVKILLGLSGFLYVLFVLIKVEKQKIKISKNINWMLFLKTTLFKLLVIATLTTLFVWLTNKAFLFHVLLNKPQLWVVILIIYSLFSVYPQELIFRTFFFKRYEALFNTSAVLIVVNAFLFALAHMLFKNTLVLVITFLGGFLFAFSYNKIRSTLLVSIEHAVYGSWLFTVGMGSILGFPS